MHGECGGYGGLEHSANGDVPTSLRFEAIADHVVDQRWAIERGLGVNYAIRYNEQNVTGSNTAK